MNKAQENDTVTVKKDEDSAVYFCVIKRYFETASCSGFVRLEALGSAVANAVAVANLLVASGVANISKVKSKEKLVTYELENGQKKERPTTHLKFDLIRSPNFEASIQQQPHHPAAKTSQFNRAPPVTNKPSYQPSHQSSYQQQQPGSYPAA